MNSSCGRVKIRALISHRLWNLGLHLQIYEKHPGLADVFAVNIGICPGNPRAGGFCTPGLFEIPGMEGFVFFQRKGPASL